MLGIIGGTSLLFSELPDLERIEISTPFGSAELLSGEIAILLRHQRGLPPHRINHRAHLAALAIHGVDRIIAFGSTGSLKTSIRPGSLMIPHDYISLSEIPSIHDHAIGHVIPTISRDLVHEIEKILPGISLGGTYIQTRGPRIETMAEVRALSTLADIVGMTLGSEATLATELDIPFCALCSVDNYAHGLSDETLSYEKIVDTTRIYKERTDEIMRTIISQLA